MTDSNNHHAWIDEATQTMVVSEVEPDEVMVSGLASNFNGRVQRALASWWDAAHNVDATSGPARRPSGLFNRDRFVTPAKIYDQMALAYDAAEDDIIASVLETSESFAFQKVWLESIDPDQEDVWNQLSAKLNLDDFVRTAHRELMLLSQFYPVMWWERQRFRVRGEADSGRPRRKEYEIMAPSAIGFLDPTRVVPVNPDLWGNTQLAWIADKNDSILMGDIEKNMQTDELVSQMFIGPYTPSDKEKAKLANEDVPPDRLILLNPEMVWRHTLTKAPYERWARVRMKSLFPLLDLKHQLRDMDRAFLLAGVNFIILVTRGSDKFPSSQPEVEETAGQVRSQSKSPIIVSDHRISIEIITPDVEHVLNRVKWNVLDERLMMRMWGTLVMPTESGGRETSITISRVVARALNSRRHMLKRGLEANLVKKVVEHPFNVNNEFDSATKVMFTPTRIELDFDPNLAKLILQIRDRGDISRESMLGEFGFDQPKEAMRREREEELWDEFFKPVMVPFDSPNRGQTPDQSGNRGGRPPGTPETEDQPEQDREADG